MLLMVDIILRTHFPLEEHSITNFYFLVDIFMTKKI